MDVLRAVGETYVSSKVEDGQLELLVRRRLRTFLQTQVEMRGIPIRQVEIDGMAESVRCRKSEQGIMLEVPDEWEHQVDQMLMNRRCGRCGALVAAGNHTNEECDSAVLEGVMES